MRVLCIKNLIQVTLYFLILQICVVAVHGGTNDIDGGIKGEKQAAYFAVGFKNSESYKSFLDRTNNSSARSGMHIPYSIQTRFPKYNMIYCLFDSADAAQAWKEQEGDSVAFIEQGELSNFENLVAYSFL